MGTYSLLWNGYTLASGNAPQEAKGNVRILNNGCYSRVFYGDYWQSALKSRSRFGSLDH